MGPIAFRPVKRASDNAGVTSVGSGQAAPTSTSVGLVTLNVVAPPGSTRGDLSDLAEQISDVERVLNAARNSPRQAPATLGGIIGES
jgi:hypothetical protein